MKKIAVILILLVVGLQYGYRYIMSEDFQKYGDTTKAPWTCKATNLVGNFDILMSDYQEGYGFFQRVMKRCPDSPMAEEAEFRSAQCLESMGHAREAAAAYDAFAENHKDSPKAPLASKAAGAIRVGL